MAEQVQTSHASAPPIPRTRLIGREPERAAGRSHLVDEAAPLLTLTGPGGVGKTHLALAIASDAAGHFAEGVVWVDLAPVSDPMLVPVTVARALNIAIAPGVSVSTELARHLRPRQTLLLLDNCEHVLAAAADLVALVLAACPALQILATSRAPLHVRGEQALPVEPLPLPPAAARAASEAIARNEAVRLFVERARAVRPGFNLDETNAPAVTAVCRHLDGLPLAIELAAARVKVLSPEALLAQTSNRLRLLNAGPRDLPPRQQTIRDAIAWSYGLLDPASRHLFQCLSVFAGGWTLEAAEVVGGRAGGASPRGERTRDVSAPSVLDGVSVLLDQSLVRPMENVGEPRFTMLETIREFGLEQLAESGEERSARDRHAAYFVDLSETAELHLHGVTGGQAAWMARMDADLDNFRAAIDWLLANGEGTQTLRLVIGLEGYIGARLFEAEARQWAESALALATDAPALVRAAALYGLITRTAQIGDFAAASAAAAEALALAEMDGDPFALGRAHFGVGMAWTWRKDWEPAAAAYARSIPCLRQTGRIDFLALALANLGEALHMSGNLAAARPLLDEALTFYDHANDPWGYSATLRVRADLARTEGDQTLAVQMFQDSIDVAQSLRDERSVMYAVAGLAGVARATGQPERAARLLGAIADAQDVTGYMGILSDKHVAPMIATTRAELGEEAFAGAWNTGRSMTWADAVADARAVLDPHAAPPPDHTNPPRSEAFDLTRREREILVLLCQRLTDPEIAATLFLSPRTVSNHVANILAKLGVPNRRAAAAIAARLELN